jgi:hypothetical protein
LAYEDSIAVSFRHVFISATSYNGIPSSKRTLHISLLSEASKRYNIYSGGFVSPVKPFNLQSHSLLAICDFLFNIMAGTLHIWRLFSSICYLRMRHAVLTRYPVYMAFTFHGVNIGVRNEIDANVGMIEHSSLACYAISAERKLCNLYFTPQ